MLVLGFDVNQGATITHNGETLRVVYVELRSGRVRLGFEGPLSFDIVRDDAKDREAKHAESILERLEETR